jgi:hypothetical protein
MSPEATPAHMKINSVRLLSKERASTAVSKTLPFAIEEEAAGLKPRAG